MLSSSRPSSEKIQDQKHAQDDETGNKLLNQIVKFTRESDELGLQGLLIENHITNPFEFKQTISTAPISITPAGYFAYTGEKVHARWLRLHFQSHINEMAFGAGLADDKDFIEECLGENADINQVAIGATIGGNIQTAETLRRRGANIDTIIDYTIEYHRFEYLKLFLNKKAIHKHIPLIARDIPTEVYQEYIVRFADIVKKQTLSTIDEQIKHHIGGVIDGIKFLIAHYLLSLALCFITMTLLDKFIIEIDEFSTIAYLTIILICPIIPSFDNTSKNFHHFRKIASLLQLNSMIALPIAAPIPQKLKCALNENIATSVAFANKYQPRDILSMLNNIDNPTLISQIIAVRQRRATGRLSENLVTLINHRCELMKACGFNFYEAGIVIANAHAFRWAFIFLQKEHNLPADLCAEVLTSPDLLRFPKNKIRLSSEKIKILYERYNTHLDLRWIHHHIPNFFIKSLALPKDHPYQVTNRIEMISMSSRYFFFAREKITSVSDEKRKTKCCVVL